MTTRANVALATSRDTLATWLCVDPSALVSFRFVHSVNLAGCGGQLARAPGDRLSPAGISRFVVPHGNHVCSPNTRVERHTAYSLDLAMFLQNVAFRPNGDTNLKSDVTQRTPVAFQMYDSSDFYCCSNAAFAMH
jgi:hypothetical protein